MCFFINGICYRSVICFRVCRFIRFGLQCFDACCLGVRKGIRPEWWGAGVLVCLELGADLHMAQLMLLPLTGCCFSKIQIGFAFLVPAHPGSPGKRAVKRVCVCVCVCVDLSYAVKLVCLFVCAVQVTTCEF